MQANSKKKSVQSKKNFLSTYGIQRPERRLSEKVLEVQRLPQQLSGPEDLYFEEINMPDIHYRKAREEGRQAMLPRPQRHSVNEKQSENMYHRQEKMISNSIVGHPGKRLSESINSSVNVGGVAKHEKVQVSGSEQNQRSIKITNAYPRTASVSNLQILPNNAKPREKVNFTELITSMEERFQKKMAFNGFPNFGSKNHNQGTEDTSVSGAPKLGVAIQSKRIAPTFQQGRRNLSLANLEDQTVGKAKFVKSQDPLTQSVNRISPTKSQSMIKIETGSEVFALNHQEAYQWPVLNSLRHQPRQITETNTPINQNQDLCQSSPKLLGAKLSQRRRSQIEVSNSPLRSPQSIFPQVINRVNQTDAPEARNVLSPKFTKLYKPANPKTHASANFHQNLLKQQLKAREAFTRIAGMIKADMEKSPFKRKNLTKSVVASQVSLKPKQTEARFEQDKSSTKIRNITNSSVLEPLSGQTLGNQEDIRRRLFERYDNQINQRVVRHSIDRNTSYDKTHALDGNYFQKFIMAVEKIDGRLSPISKPTKDRLEEARGSAGKGESPRINSQTKVAQLKKFLRRSMNEIHVGLSEGLPSSKVDYCNFKEGDDAVESQEAKPSGFTAFPFIKKIDSRNVASDHISKGSNADSISQTRPPKSFVSQDQSSTFSPSVNAYQGFSSKTSSLPEPRVAHNSIGNIAFQPRAKEKPLLGDSSNRLNSSVLVNSAIPTNFQVRSKDASNAAKSQVSESDHRLRSRQPSSQSIHKCDITLSEQSEAPQRVAGTGVVPFSSITSQQPPPQTRKRSFEKLDSASNSANRDKQADSLASQALMELIEEEKRRHPELNQLSNQHLSSLILAHLLSQLKEESQQYGTQSMSDDYNFQGINKIKHVKTPQIVNHFNITINHASAHPPRATNIIDTTHLSSSLSQSDIQAILVANSQALVRDRQAQSAEGHSEEEQLVIIGDGDSIEEDHRLKDRVGALESTVDQRSSPIGKIKLTRVKRMPVLNTNVTRSATKPSNAGVGQIQSRVPISSADSKLPLDKSEVKPPSQLPTLSSQQQPNQTTSSGKDQSAKRQLFNSSIKPSVNPKVDFTSVVKSDCEMMSKANKKCTNLRQQQDGVFSGANDGSLDILVVTFEGVLGAFLSGAPIPGEEAKSDYLLLRPGVAKAFQSLVRNFKIAIVTADRSSLRQKAILKALNRNEIPFDAFYRRTAPTSDNFFTFESIRSDLGGAKSQLLFLTSVNYPFSVPRDQKKQLVEQAEIQYDFVLMPLSTSLERLLVVCVTHLLVEADMTDDTDSGQINFGEALVCDLGAVADTIVNFFKVAQTFKQNDLKKEMCEKSLRVAKEKRLGISGEASKTSIHSDRASASKVRDPRNKPTSESSNKKREQQRRNVKAVDSSSTLRIPPKSFSAFELLTNAPENSENLYPISFFQKKLEKHRGPNSFLKAFEKGMTYRLFTVSYHQPLLYNRKILTSRLSDTTLRIRRKLMKIKQAVRNIAIKEAQLDEKTFRTSQKNYELTRKQPAFHAFQKYNSQYFAEIYDECNVRLPCHPSKEQFEKLGSIYRSLMSRLDNLINNTFPFSQNETPFYNLMLFEGHLFNSNKAPVEVVDAVLRRQFVLKDQYWSQTQALMQELQKTSGLGPARNCGEGYTKVQHTVPDLISWLSARQQPLSAANSVPKAAKPPQQISPIPEENKK